VRAFSREDDRPVKPLLLAISALVIVAMLGDPARACSCFPGLQLAGPSVSAEGGVVLEWWALPPDAVDSLELRGPSGESVAFSVKSWTGGQTCGLSLAVLTPAAPLVVGATYEVSAPAWEYPDRTVAFTPVAASLGEDSTPSVKFERVRHSTNRGDMSSSCYFGGVPWTVTFDYTAIVTVSVPGALDGPFVVVAQADDPPDPSWVSVASVAGSGDVATLPLPLPDPAACVNVEVWNAAGKKTLSVARCQPDHCSDAGVWYTGDNQGHPTSVTPISCDLAEDSASGCNAGTAPPTGLALWFLALLGALGWRRRRAPAAIALALAAVLVFPTDARACSCWGYFLSLDYPALDGSPLPVDTTFVVRESSQYRPNGLDTLRLVDASGAEVPMDRMDLAPFLDCDYGWSALAVPREPLVPGSTYTLELLDAGTPETGQVVASPTTFQVGPGPAAAPPFPNVAVTYTRWHGYPWLDSCQFVSDPNRLRAIVDVQIDGDPSAKWLVTLGVPGESERAPAPWALVAGGGIAQLNRGLESPDTCVEVAVFDLHANPVTVQTLCEPDICWTHDDSAPDGRVPCEPQVEPVPVETAESLPDAPESDGSTRADPSGCGLVNPAPPTQVLPLLVALFLLQRRERTRLRRACAES
jgi:MYXO-CTERM domain-containing protein